MEKDFINNLSEEYEINPKTVTKIANIISTSEGVAEDNFAVVLETAVSNFSSSKTLETEVYYPHKGPVSIDSSIEYALNVEIYNNEMGENVKRTR